MRPTEPGWHWYWRNGGPPEAVHVVFDMQFRLDEHDIPTCMRGLVLKRAGSDYYEWLDDVPGQFVGPLVPPERPKE